MKGHNIRKDESHLPIKGKSAAFASALSERKVGTQKVSEPSHESLFMSFGTEYFIRYFKGKICLGNRHIVSKKKKKERKEKRKEKQTSRAGFFRENTEIQVGSLRH